MNKLEKEKMLLSLCRGTLGDLLRGKSRIDGKKIKREIKKIKKVNLKDREVYFFEGEYENKIGMVNKKGTTVYKRYTVEVKYTLVINKNSWTFIEIERDNGPWHERKWKRNIISHVFPKNVGDFRSSDEAFLLERFVGIRETLESLICQYGK